MSEDTHPIPWEHAEDHVHAKLWEDEYGYEKWNQIGDVCEKVWKWEYDGSCDLKECETWKCLVECIAKHKEGEWSSDWESDWEVPLEYDPYISD